MATSTMAFDLQGHRGARGLAPENTLASFAAALEIGVKTLETDLAVTADDVVVLSHDPLLNPAITRRPGGQWLAAPGPSIRSLTLDQVQSYDVGRIDPRSAYAGQFPHQVAADGARIPTLAQLFAMAEATEKAPRYNLEIKISPLAQADTADVETFVRLVVAEVRRARLERRVTIQSFDWRAVRASRHQAREIETICLTVDTPAYSNLRGADGAPSPWLDGLDAGPTRRSVPDMVVAAGCRIWSPYWRNLDGALVAEAHAAGLRVVPWTVNVPDDMAVMVDFGVDGLITDYPDRARAVLAQKNVPLP